MSVMQKHHKELNADGAGKCSVPMWSGGSPGGFCDAPAYGEPTKSATYYSHCQRRTVRFDGKYDGYVPGLACPCHAGPDSRVFMDGDQFCAVYANFINLQESQAGFGDTAELARAALLKDKS